MPRASIPASRRELVVESLDDPDDHDVSRHEGAVGERDAASVVKGEGEQRQHREGHLCSSDSKTPQNRASGSCGCAVEEDGHSNSSRRDTTTDKMGNRSQELSKCSPDVLSKAVPVRNDKNSLEGEKEKALVCGGENGVLVNRDELIPVGKENRIVSYVKRTHLLDKFVFVVSVMSLILLSICLVNAQWILPYYFTVSFPILMIIRTITFWQYKWQYFLIDLCYFGNTFMLIALWAAPDNQIVFCVLFGLTNGPLAWAIPLFGNSIVFHQTEKMTSVFIHALPLFVTYSIRWFPAYISRFWYKSFVSTFDQDISYLMIWVVAVPYGCYIVHNCFTILVIHVICRPGPEYLYTYNYLTESKFRKYSKCLGPRGTPFLYYGFNWFLGFLTILCSALFYSYFIVHTVAMCVFLLVAIWNGATYYMDKFAAKGHNTSL